MLFLLALSCLAMATVGSVVVYQRGAAARLSASNQGALPAPAPAKKPAPSQEDPTLDTLRPGDVVQDGSDDFVVDGVLHYQEERDAWILCHLDGGDSQRWLEVRKNGSGLRVAFLEVVTDVPTFGQLGAGLTYRGRPFNLAGRGDARTRAEGDTAERKEGALKYARYVGPSGEVLVIEEQAGAKRALFGASVPPSSLTLLGGELVRARDSA